MNSFKKFNIYTIVGFLIVSLIVSILTLSLSQQVFSHGDSYDENHHLYMFEIVRQEGILTVETNPSYDLSQLPPDVVDEVKWYRIVDSDCNAIFYDKDSANITDVATGLSVKLRSDDDGVTYCFEFSGLYEPEDAFEDYIFEPFYTQYTLDKITLHFQQSGNQVTASLSNDLEAETTIDESSWKVIQLDNGQIDCPKDYSNYEILSESQTVILDDDVRGEILCFYVADLSGITGVSSYIVNHLSEPQSEIGKPSDLTNVDVNNDQAGNVEAGSNNLKHSSDDQSSNTGLIIGLILLALVAVAVTWLVVKKPKRDGLEDIDSQSADEESETKK